MSSLVNQQTHTHTHTHAHTHKQTHAHTHTRTHAHARTPHHTTPHHTTHTHTPTPTQHPHAPTPPTHPPPTPTLVHDLPLTPPAVRNIFVLARKCHVRRASFFLLSTKHHTTKIIRNVHTGGFTEPNLNTKHTTTIFDHKPPIDALKFGEDDGKCKQQECS